MNTVTFALAFALRFFLSCFLICLLSFLAVLPVGLTASLNEDAWVIVSPTCLTPAATALTSGGVLVWLSVTWPGPGTFASIAAVPFFFFLAIELIVILFEGAAASRQGSVGPAIRSAFGEFPFRFARPMKSVL